MRLALVRGPHYGPARAAGALMSTPETPAPAGGQHTYYPEVDALRAFAVTAVILQHCQLLPFGWTGVWLFFVISGFVVTHTLLERGEPGQARGGGFLDFILRRAFRIWPVLWLYTGAAIAAALIAGTAFNWQAALAAITFTSNFYTMVGGPDLWPISLSHTWTLAVEEHFYIAFGLLFCFAPRAVFARALIAMIIGAPLIRAALSLWLSQNQVEPLQAAFAVYTMSPGHFDAFAAGGLIALYRLRVLEAGKLVWWFTLAAIAAFVLHVSVYLGFNVAADRHGFDLFRDLVSGIMFGQGREIFIYTPIWMLAAALLMWTLKRPPLLQPLLALPQLQWAGRISYSAYVYHPAIIVLAHAIVAPFAPAQTSMTNVLIQGAMVFAIAYPATLLIAHISHVTFEKPMIALGRRLETRRRARRAALTPAAAPST